MNRLRVLLENEGELAIAVCGPVLITFAGGRVTSDYLLEASRAGRELSRTYPRAVGSLTITSAEVPLPDPEIRSLATQVSRESNAWVKAATTVVDGTGFRASAIRSVLVAMTVFQGGPPRRVFSEIDPAMTWLTSQMDLDAADRSSIRAWSLSVLRRSARPL